MYMYVHVVHLGQVIAIYYTQMNTVLLVYLHVCVCVCVCVCVFKHHFSLNTRNLVSRICLYKSQMRTVRVDKNLKFSIRQEHVANTLDTRYMRVLYAQGVR